MKNKEIRNLFYFLGGLTVFGGIGIVGYKIGYNSGWHEATKKTISSDDANRRRVECGILRRENAILKNKMFSLAEKKGK